MYRYLWIILFFSLSACTNIDPTCCLARAMEQVTTADLIGEWALTDSESVSLVMEFHDDFRYELSVAAHRDQSITQGAWHATTDRHFTIDFQGDRVTGQLLSPSHMAINSPFFMMYLRKLDASGRPLSLDPATSVVTTPYFMVDQVESIHFRGVYSTLGWRNDHQYTLQWDKATDTFVGTATIHPTSSAGVTTTVPISLTSDIVDGAMSRLAGAPLWVGLLVPQITHTDDYPEFYLEVVTAGSRIIYQSNSQGATHIPWAVAINERRYVSFSEDIFAGLEQVNGRLQAMLNVNGQW